VSRRSYAIDLTSRHKVIVGEGESDRSFFAEFCARNVIEGFDYAFTGMHSNKYTPSGFDCFVAYLPVLSRLAGFSSLTDVVLVCDRTDRPVPRLSQLRWQIHQANTAIGSQIFSEQPNENVVATTGMPRLHVLMIPNNQLGGLETACFNVARDNLNNDGNEGTQIEGWVNDFATDACVGWTTEKRDKLRLQAFISAAWKKKPEMHFSQLFDITGNHLIPLDSPTFGQIRDFLRDVAAL